MGVWRDAPTDEIGSPPCVKLSRLLSGHLISVSDVIKKETSCLPLRRTLHEKSSLDLEEVLMLHLRECGPEALEFRSGCLKQQPWRGQSVLAQAANLPECHAKHPAWVRLTWSRILKQDTKSGKIKFKELSL